ncbi:MAG: J domain-containing protein [Lachnospiraceae bacterium]|nr:J domain-containing protein [Lachnospiraceae bacterium]
MTQKEAKVILGIMQDVTEEQLKKRYRYLMQKVHPDAVEAHDYPYEANEINVAYEYMLEELKKRQTKVDKRLKKKEEERIKWNAPTNQNAYAEREIYQYFEDADGERVGIVSVDFGKYIWTTDEDFPLFLKSLYKLSKDIIAADDERKGINRSSDIDLMADIAYLLSGQFISADTTLSLMRAEDGVYGDEKIYYTKGVLEWERVWEEGKYESGVILFPAYVKKHRLYVCDDRKHVLGYLSFKDDRLLFGIIPLFERRVVQIKMQMGQKASEVDLWIRKLPETEESGIDSINLKIEQRLAR